MVGGEFSVGWDGGAKGESRGKREVGERQERGREGGRMREIRGQIGAREE